MMSAESEASPMQRVRAANRLTQARQFGQVVKALPPPERPMDEAAAYDIQDLVHRTLMKSGGGKPVGYKIGCTTRVMQQMLGIPNPCAGGILSANVYHERAILLHKNYRRPGVECEMAVLIGNDLDAREAPFSVASIEGHVEAVMAAIEIVDDRYDDYRQIGTPTLIADDFFHAGCVLGPVCTHWRQLDLEKIVGRTVINGTLKGEGTGADVLGHPFAAVAWLASHLAQRGASLRRNDFVLTGSVVETRWVNCGDKVVISMDELGEVCALFS
jgi:2-keto-4-pentenoate hydratase